MIARNPGKKNKANVYFAPTQKAYFALRLHENPNN